MTLGLDEKIIEVKGVQLKLSKIDVFRQDELIQALLPTIASAFQAAASSGAKTTQAMVLAGVEVVLKSLPSQTRSAIIFNDLLPCVKLTSGIPLIGRADGGQRVVMAQELHSIYDLYKIAFEVFLFNFQDFFDSVSNDLAKQGFPMTRS